MGVGAPDCCCSPVKQVSHGPLFTAAFGVKVHQDDLLTNLAHIAVCDGEGVVGVAVQGEATEEVHYADIPEGRPENGDPASGALGSIVYGTQNPGFNGQIVLHLGTDPGVVAKGNDIGPGAENLLSLFRGDADYISVFTVDNGEGDLIGLLKLLQIAFQKLQTGDVCLNLRELPSRGAGLLVFSFYHFPWASATGLSEQLANINCRQC